MRKESIISSIEHAKRKSGFSRQESRACSLFGRRAGQARRSRLFADHAMRREQFFVYNMQ
ncbi:hypothetical protein [Paenibacillus naphthalenovorans]|uniref:hypothetical protein n=1 Tax=Paenibacillus naphthalenovorans TaxID=162209 RepID=UPI001C316D11|nr:hypothetical protein [Paenibacillus naphthalenovorans]